MNILKRCSSCGAYSLSAKCRCGTETRTPHPPKFSLMQKYAKYRKAKKII